VRSSYREPRWIIPLGLLTPILQCSRGSGTVVFPCLGFLADTSLGTRIMSGIAGTAMCWSFTRMTMTPRSSICLSR